MLPPWGGDCCAGDQLQTLPCLLPQPVGCDKKWYPYPARPESSLRDRSPHRGLRSPSNRQPRLLLVAEIGPPYQSPPTQPFSCTVVSRRLMESSLGMTSSGGLSSPLVGRK